MQACAVGNKRSISIFQENIMKKVSFAVALLIFALSVTGCITRVSKFQSYDARENITGVEIYYIDEHYVNDIDDTRQPVKVLEREHYTEIINELEALEFADVIPIFMPSDPNFSLLGFVIRIEYASGAHQLVSNQGVVYTYDPEGVARCFFGSTDDATWDSLIIKYIGEEAFGSYGNE